MISAPFIPGSGGYEACGLTLYNEDRIAMCRVTDMGDNEIDKLCEIWVMEGEGCWIKQFSVGPIPNIFFQQGFWKNGELLFNNVIHACDQDLFSQLVLYNPCTRELRYLGPRATLNGYQAFVYHESLVSVNGGIHQRKGKLSDSAVAQFFFARDRRYLFFTDLLHFMDDFQFMEEHNTEPRFTNADHKKAHRLLSKLWESCEYSSNVPVI